MDIVEATQQDIVKVIDGKTYKLKRLTMRDMGSLATAKQQIDANNLHVKLSALKDAGLKQEQLPAIINDLTKQISYNELMPWAMTPEGIMAVIEIAGGEEELFETLDHLELPFLALELMSIPHVRVSSEEDGSEGEIPFSEKSAETVTL